VRVLEIYLGQQLCHRAATEILFSIYALGWHLQTNKILQLGCFPSNPSNSPLHWGRVYSEQGVWFITLERWGKVWCWSQAIYLPMPHSPPLLEAVLYWETTSLIKSLKGNIHHVMAQKVTEKFCGWVVVKSIF